MQYYQQPYKTKQKTRKATYPYALPERPAAAVSQVHPLVKWGLPGTAALAATNITTIHIYDFDNTLFVTPSGNHELFTGQALDLLYNPSGIAGGGWWQDTRFLKATGEGWDAEKARAWEGWWNEDVVTLVKDSMADSNIVTVLLTGRRSHFGPLIQEMCTAKGLVFDAIVPRSGNFKDTLDFKMNFLTETLDHYKNADRIDVYEDRGWHARKFKTFLSEYQQAVRHELKYNVTLVSGLIRFLEPAVESALVHQAVQEHNDAYQRMMLMHPFLHRLTISEIHLFTGYILKSESRARLLAAYLKLLPPDESLKIHANAIVIRRMTVSKKDAASLNYGKHYHWKATHIGNYNDEQWAIKMEPIGFKSRAEQPMAILAQRKRTTGGSVFSSTITEWTPLEESIEIETQLGDWSVKKITKKS